MSPRFRSAMSSMNKKGSSSRSRGVVEIGGTCVDMLKGATRPIHMFCFMQHPLILGISIALEDHRCLLIGSRCDRVLELEVHSSESENGSKSILLSVDPARDKVLSTEERMDLRCAVVGYIAEV